MENLPAYIKVVFIFTTVLTLFMLFKGTNYSKPIIIVVLLWVVIQSAVSLTSFYTVTNAKPPRFGLLLFPPLIFILIGVLPKKTRRVIDGLNGQTLTLLHIIRIPVEIVLYWLFLYKVVPGLITFEGRNFDILCGLTAPLVYYFGYVKNVLGRKALIAWNIICLIILTNVVITAVLSAPFPIQQFAFDQPNIAMLYFPFILLPGCLVPAVLFAHLVCLRQLINSRNKNFTGPLPPPL